jgi:hypothetical protein
MVRLEKNNSFVTFEKEVDKVLISWGITGFSTSGDKTETIESAEQMKKGLLMDGYIEVDEIPLGEPTNEAVQNILDWFGAKA